VQKLEDLEQANFDLSTKLSDAHNGTALVVATRDEHSNKLDELQQKYHDVQALLLEKEAQLSESLYARKLIVSENVNLVSQVSTLSEMVAGRNAKIETLQTEASCYEYSTRDIMSRIVSLEEEHGNCSLQRQALQDEIDRANLFTREGERRERELKEEISSLRSSLRESRESYESLQTSNRKLNQKLKAQVEKVDELMSSSRESNARIQQLERVVKEREHTVTSVRGELEFLTKLNSDQQASLRAEIESLNKNVGS
jgi:chromosome segregation ATPase